MNSAPCGRLLLNKKSPGCSRDCLLYERAISMPGPQSSGVAETKESVGSAKRLTQSMSRTILRTLVNDPREDAKGQAWCPFIA